MPSPLIQAGAAADPSHSAPLHTNRFFTGLWTQRSPLRDAATPYLYEKFYSASRFDSIIGGVNSEVTTRLTLARRPGHSVYNSTVLQYQRIEPFRTFVNGQENLRVMADTGPLGSTNTYGNVSDVTGPSGRQVLYPKIAGSKTTFFKSVGNELFMGDEAQTRKWVLSLTAWQPNTLIQAGTFIVDTALNIQYTANGGYTGATQPAWHETVGATTVDTAAVSVVTWLCKGPSLMAWGIAGPSIPPLISQIPNAYLPGDYISQSLFLQAGAAWDHVTNTIQTLIAPGFTSATIPTYANSIGTQTTDGSVIWQCAGSAARASSTNYAAGQLIVVSGSAMWQCIQSGTSAATAPSFTVTGVSIVIDGAVIWQAAGAAVDVSDPASDTEGTIRSTTVLATLTITDSNGNTQQALGSGTAYSGGEIPAWSTVLGGLSPVVGSMTFRCVALAPVITAPWVYAYAFRNSVTRHISTASPITAPIAPALGYAVSLNGYTSTDFQVDTVRVYRTVQGGSTLYFLADIPVAQTSPASNAPIPGAWHYYDDADDSALNILIEAQIAESNNPPPANIAALEYHLGRLWGFNNNVLLYSGGPDTLSGSGNEAWPPLNSFTLPSRGVRLWPTSIGLIVFTQSDVYIVLGQGTSASPLYITSFQDGVGLLNYDSFAVNGSTAYLMTTANRCISFDPSAGETEVGFPIGDILAGYSQATARMAYHEGSSADTALYVADGQVGWYRMSTISAPESGQVWSTQARIVGGVATVASVEITPGVKKLLVANYPTGPLLMRDSNQAADNGIPYPAFTTLGSIVLAQPGQIAGVHFLTTDSVATGTRPTLGLLMGEITGTFDMLSNTRQDPTILPASKTIWGNRFYMSQNQTPAWCRHMQVQIIWPTEAAMNELLSYTIFGEIKSEKEEG